MNNGAARVTLVGHLCIVFFAALPGRHDGCSVRVPQCNNFGGRHAIVGEVVHDLPAAKGGNVAKLTVSFKRPQAQRGAQCIDGVKGIAVAINGPVAMSTLGDRCRGFRLGLLGRLRRGGLRGAGVGAAVAVGAAVGSGVGAGVAVGAAVGAAVGVLAAVLSGADAEPLSDTAALCPQAATLNASTTVKAAANIRFIP